MRPLAAPRSAGALQRRSLPWPCPSIIARSHVLRLRVQMLAYPNAAALGPSSVLEVAMRRSSQPSLWRVAQIVGGSLLAVAVLIVGIGALLPRDWQVQETILINGAPADVHAWVGDLERWPHWAQWNQPDLWPHNRVSKPSSGPGATLHWYGRARGGDAPPEGEVRIVRSDPTSGVWFENRTPSSELSEANVRYQQRPSVTLVTWEDRGRLPPIIGGLFLDLFQQRLHSHMAGGLERLKDLVEGQPSSKGPPPAPPPG